MFDPNRFITDRARAVDASGIRRVFDLAATLKDPVNLSIGQPDFDVPDAIKRGAIEAIQNGFNRYTQTQGIPQLRDAVRARLSRQFPQTFNDDAGLLITSGVSGGLMLAMLACVQPGDEVLIPDPYFVMYKHLVALAGGTAVYIDTYPDFQLRPERIEPLITKRTKLLLFNSPSNPTGAVATDEVCRQVAELADRHNLLLVSDEIYDEFCYEKSPAPETSVTPVPETSATPATPDRPREVGEARLPSPMNHSQNVLLLRGYSKTYAMTGWRLGYAAGPAAIIDEMTKLQQYSFVCAPSMTQMAGVLALDVDVSGHVQDYRRKRDRVVERLGGHYELTTPGGAFYAFPKIPDRLGLTATRFAERAVTKNLLIIPGNVFSQRDTHFRISYACDDTMLDRGLDILVELAS